MEATVVSLGKAVLDGALDYAKSAAAEEAALQLGLESDVAFVTDELEMMQSFLMTADEERDKNNMVLNTWVKQVRDVAYNTEDNLVDFAIHAEREKLPFLGCIPRNPCHRRRIAMEMKKLKARVEDVSSRNLRYRLIKDGAGGSKAAGVGVEQGSIASSAAAMFGIDGEWNTATEEEKPKVDLAQVIIRDVADLQVIAMWGTSSDLGKTSEIRKAYDNPEVNDRFGCRAWVRVMHPFDPKEFLQSFVRQFYVNSSKEQGTTVGAHVLLQMEKMDQTDLVHEFNTQVSSNRFLIVINDLTTLEEWDCIKTYFPNKNNGSRIIIATQQVEIASLCTEQPYQVSELKQLSSDQVLYLFHKVEKPEVCPAKPISRSTSVTAIEIEEEGQQSNDVRDENAVYTTSTAERKLDRSKTRVVTPEDVVGRSTEKQKVIDLVGHPNDSQSLKVISVWGMGGIGKTTLVRSVYRSEQLGGWKRAWATALRPFNREALLRNLALQLQINIQEDSAGAGDTQNIQPQNIQQRKKNIGAMKYDEVASELSRLLSVQNCLIVLDDLSSTQEWDSIIHILGKSKRIIVTTREKFVAKHCSHDDHNMYSLHGLEDAVALDLFKKKVFKDATSFDLHPGMLDQAKLILKKCHGLPLAISTIGGYLANKPKTAMEWRKLNEGLTAELEMNPELKMIKAVLMRSYDGLPYGLKASFLYLSIFPEDHIIQRKRVVRRWIAEGYSREMQPMAAEQVAGKHFDELLDRSMILLLEARTPGSIDSCQLHDLIREICVSKAREDNLVFTLEEGCSLGGVQGTIRHLAISSNWKRDKEVMQRMLDLSHVRSLTVFGEWRSFFICSKMRFLRVLDLEHTVGLRDHHLGQIGELLHLRYLSLRGCVGICELPDSFENLRQLQTLDIRGTRIWRLPLGVTKLKKLQYLHASGISKDIEDTKQDDIFWEYKSLIPLEYDEHVPCVCCVYALSACSLLYSMGHLVWRPQRLEHRLGRTGTHVLEEGVSRHDICNLHCYFMTYDAEYGKLYGVRVPRGISKLKALHTLRDVNVAWGNATFQELRELTQLRKLGVAGVSKENNGKFWPAIAEHNQLRSLFVDCRGGSSSDVQLDDCLGGSLLPPKCLESLKMRGKLIKVTEWVRWLQNLSKLQLEYALLKQEDLEAIGKLPNLVVLRLNRFSVSVYDLRFPGRSFPSLLVLELNHELRLLEFKRNATPKLEVLQATGEFNLREFSGLEFVTSLKEIRLDHGRVKELVERKLAEYTNNVTIRML